MRKTIFVKGEYYHLYNRGVDKRAVFTSREEYGRFMAYLFLLNDAENKRIDHLFNSKTIWEAKPSSPLVAIGAYCLMPNHFHLYVTPLADGGVSKFMQRVQTAYTMYFNRKHNRSGALFQGTFKSSHVSSDRYAKYLFSYIHLNPAKLKDPKWKERGPRDLHNLKKYLRQHPYSSLQEYLDRNHLITSPDLFPAYIKKRRDIDEHIDSWLDAKNWKV